MAGDSPYEAAEAYLRPIQRAISCLTRSRVNVERPPSGLSPAQAPTLTFPLMLAGGEAVPLGRAFGRTPFALSMRQRYSLVHTPDDRDRGPWKVQTRDYEYAVYSITEGGPKELFAYHYHPSSVRSRIKRPHLHFRSAAGVTGALEAAHYLTGRVALEEVVWMLLDDQDNQFNVRPLQPRWREILQESLIAFEQWRTWPGTGGTEHPLT